MIGEVYKITNSINKKVYIGKTYNSIEVRFKQHLNDGLNEKNFNRPLYRAFAKYGVENFNIETLGKFEEGILEEKEQEFIIEYDSYKNGYNATLGGDGSRYLGIPDEIFISTYQELGYVNKTAEALGCGIDTVRKVLNNNNITIGSPRVNKRMHKVLMTDTCGNTLTFDNAQQASEWIVEHKLSVNNVSAIRSNINRVVRGDRNSYLQRKWEKVD